MGQSITVESKQWDAVCVFTTDRSITGQDGAGFDSAEAAEDAGGFPGNLASRLFATDKEIDHVYVASNDVVVRRTTSWSVTDVSAAASTIENLFIHYTDKR
jgi:hypothetical protein